MRTHVDWWTFRTSGEPLEAVDALGGAFGSRSVGLRARAGGWMGYASSADVMLDGMRVGLMGWGGEHQRDWVTVQLDGGGCAWVCDWSRAQDAIGSLPGASNRRIDIALDTCDGSVSDEVVTEAYANGLFVTHGRPPKLERHASMKGAMNAGRTIYIGSRSEAKCLRAYEKGRELLKDHPGDWEGLITHVDGAPVDDLYRLEVEFKPKSGPLPEDLIDRRDQYFAGAYPFLSRVLEVEPQIFVQRRELQAQLTLEARLGQIRHQYGTTLFTALAAHHGDITAVWDKIVGTRHNVDLVDAGVLLVEHDEA